MSPCIDRPWILEHFALAVLEMRHSSISYQGSFNAQDAYLSIVNIQTRRVRTHQECAGESYATTIS